MSYSPQLTFVPYGFGHNLNKIRYPYLASIRSALALARRISGYDRSGIVYFAICSCDDGTEESVRETFQVEIKQGELVILYYPWRDDDCRVQTEICNFILDNIHPMPDRHAPVYTMKLDADEVIHEGSFDDFEVDLHRMARAGVVLGDPHYTHLLDSHRDFDFIYRERPIISRLDSNLRFNDSDACDFGHRAPEAKTRLEIFHFGKWSPGRERESLLKEITFTKGYRSLGFPDMRVVDQLQQGYLDYDRVFENAKQHGEVREWRGTYPVFVQDWAKESLERAEQFKLDLAAGKIEPLETERWWE